MVKIDPILPLPPKIGTPILSSLSTLQSSIWNLYLYILRKRSSPLPFLQQIKDPGTRPTAAGASMGGCTSRPTEVDGPHPEAPPAENSVAPELEVKPVEGGDAPTEVTISYVLLPFYHYPIIGLLYAGKPI